jgi:N-acetylglucosaminyldiphosphoundecaprenol N-acetyl-beta-D-mannosaminyltransferase
MSIGVARFLGVNFDLLDAGQALAEVRTLAHQSVFSFIVTPNADHVAKLTGDGSDSRISKFRAAYSAARLRLCDSRIIKRLGRAYGLDLPLVTGSDLTATLLENARHQGERIAIIGGHADMISDLNYRFPGPEFHQHIPPMGVLDKPAEIAKIIEFLANVRPNYTFFAIGAPQSEIIAMQCQGAPGITGVGLCVGASIEFLTGRQIRAPRWVQAMGMEWAFRLLSNPRRLWRRYLIESPKIFAIAWREQRGFEAHSHPQQSAHPEPVTR